MLKKITEKKRLDAIKGEKDSTAENGLSVPGKQI